MLKQFHQTKQALGCDVTLVLVTDWPSTLTDHLFDLLWGIIFRFEKQFSRFLPDSELSVFNKFGGKKTKISPAFRDLLLKSKQLAKMSGGLFNPFILPALQRAGYTKSFVKGYENDQTQNYSGRLVVEPNQLKIGADWAQIPYGTALDMGGCGKGYLADLLAAAAPKNVAGFWFSLGGDIVVSGHDENNNAWRINIYDPNSPSQLSDWSISHKGETIAVATSGVTFRRGIKDGKRWHHIIDPRTQQPAVTNLSLATVSSRSAAEADVLASCAIILGEQSTNFLKKHDVLSAFLQPKTSSLPIKFGANLHPQRKAHAV